MNNTKEKTMSSFTSTIRTIEWKDTFSRMVDQTKFPEKFEYIDIKTGDEMFDAIRTMIVRGAPAIGIAGAHGIVLYAQELEKQYNKINAHIKAKQMAKAREMEDRSYDFN